MRRFGGIHALTPIFGAGGWEIKSAKSAVGEPLAAADEPGRGAGAEAGGTNRAQATAE